MATSYGECCEQPDIELAHKLSVSVAKRSSRAPTRPGQALRGARTTRLLCIPSQPKPAGKPARNTSAPPEHLSTDWVRLRRPTPRTGATQRQNVDGPDRDKNVVLAHADVKRPAAVALRDPTDEA